MVENEKTPPDIEIIAQGMANQAVAKFRETIVVTDIAIGRAAMLSELAVQMVILSMGGLNYDRSTAEKECAGVIANAFDHFDADLERLTQEAHKAGVAVPAAVEARVQQLTLKKRGHLDG